MQCQNPDQNDGVIMEKARAHQLGLSFSPQHHHGGWWEPCPIAPQPLPSIPKMPQHPYLAEASLLGKP